MQFRGNHTRSLACLACDARRSLRVLENARHLEETSRNYHGLIYRSFPGASSKVQANRWGDRHGPSGASADPLHLSAWAGSVDLARLLVSYGADAISEDIIGWTPLHRAVQNDAVASGDTGRKRGSRTLVQHSTLIEHESDATA